MVLSEAEVLEFLAFLISSARTQLDDPAIYASMRLLTVFEALRDAVKDRVSDETRALLEKTAEMTTDAQVNLLDFEHYMQELDALNRLLAKYLVDQSSLGAGS